MRKLYSFIEKCGKYSSPSFLSQGILLFNSFIHYIILSDSKVITYTDLMKTGNRRWLLLTKNMYKPRNSHNYR